MRSSRTLCIIASALLLTSFTSCGRNADDDYGASSYIYTEKGAALFSGYIIVPSGTESTIIYSEPDESSKEVAPASLNDKVDILKDKGEWYLVSCKGFRGYIRKEYISLTEIKDTENVTTAEVTSTQTNTTAAETTETETSTTVTETTAENKEETPPDTQEENSQNDSQSPDSAPAEHRQEQNTPAPAAEYPSISISLGIDPYNGDPEKYEFYMNVNGKFSYYKYEAYRKLPDGTEVKLSSGESSESRLRLAVHDSLLEGTVVDKVKVTPYLDSVEGDPLELELYEPAKTW